MKLANSSAPISHHEQHRGHQRGLDQDAEQHRPRQPAAQQCEQEAAEGADAARLGGREHAEIDAAHDDGEQQRHAPHLPESGPALRPGRVGRGRAKLRPEPDHRLHGADIEQHADDAGDDPRDEQRADAGLGEDAVDDEDDARRDQDAEGAAGRDRSRGEAVGITEAPHRRHRHLGHGRRGRQARTADRAEPAARHDGRHRQAAAAVAEEGVRGGVELVREPRAGDEGAHEDEQRHHRELVGLRRVAGDLRDQRQGRAQADLEREPGDADDRHRERDRQPQEDQQQQDRERGQRFDHLSSSGAVPGGAASSPPPIGGMICATGRAAPPR